jgi:serine/threonine protein kinase
MKSLLEGIKDIHENGLIHKDIKTRNLMMSYLNEKPILRIIDFGLAEPIQ